MSFPLVNDARASHIEHLASLADLRCRIIVSVSVRVVLDLQGDYDWGDYYSDGYGASYGDGYDHSHRYGHGYCDS